VTVRSRKRFVIAAIVLGGLAGVYYFAVIPARCKATLARKTVGPAVARFAYDQLRSIPLRGQTADLYLARYWDRCAERRESSGEPAEAVLARLRALALDRTERREQSARRVTSLFADLLTTVSLSGDQRRRGDATVIAISRDGKAVITTDRSGVGMLWEGLPALNKRPLLAAGKITAAGFDHDAKRLATASARGTATVWENGATPVASFHHAEPMTAVALSADGKRIATAGRDRVARVWDIASGRPTGPVLRHQGEVTAITFVGDVLWTGCADGTLHEWNPTTGRHRVVARAEGGVRALSGSGRTLLVADTTGAVDVLDTATGKLVARRFVHGRDLRSVCLLRGGEVACTGGDATLRKWSLSAAIFASQAIVHPGAVYVADISTDGKTLVTGCSDAFGRLFDLVTGQPKGVPMTHAGGVLAVAARRKLVVTGGRDGAARVWNSDTGLPVGPAMQHQDWVIAVAISRDGKRIATGSLDGCARLWDATTREPIGEPMCHRGWLYALAFSPDGSKLLTGSDDGTARIWDVRSQKPLGPVMRHRLGVTSVAFGLDGKVAATASVDGHVRLWSVDSCAMIGRPLIHPDYVWGVWFASEGEVLSATRTTLRRTPVDAGGLDVDRSLSVAAAWTLALRTLDSEGTRVVIAELIAGSRVRMRVIDFANLDPSGADAASLSTLWGERLGYEITGNWVIVLR